MPKKTATSSIWTTPINSSILNYTLVAAAFFACGFLCNGLWMASQSPSNPQVEGISTLTDHSATNSAMMRFQITCTSDQECGPAGQCILPPQNQKICQSKQRPAPSPWPSSSPWPSWSPRPSESPRPSSSPWPSHSPFPTPSFNPGGVRH